MLTCSMIALSAPLKPRGTSSFQDSDPPHGSLFPRRVVMAQKREGSQFIVHLHGIKLTAEAESQIAKEVQAAALRELARIDLRGDVVVRIPRKEWYGIWIEPVAHIDLPMPGH
jgi:hypothetical protein